MEIKSLANELNTNSYPGRGIVLGQSDDGKFAVAAYFIMGRSVNSRNRIFEENERGGIRTKAFDESKMEDPSLIIYNPVLKFNGDTIVTNGDQTDTIYDSFSKGDCYHDALITREFEPDAPNYTPRISGILKENGNYFSFLLIIRVSSSFVSRLMKRTKRETLLSSLRLVQIILVNSSISLLISTGVGSPSNDGIGLPSHLYV